MKAITILQPWAWLIGHGPKRVENRQRQVKYRGPLAIHAGLGDWPGGAEWIQQHLGITVPADLPRGVITHVCELFDCVRYDDAPQLHADPCASGTWCLLLRDVRALPEPIKIRGQQFLFDVPQLAGLTL